MLDIFVSLRDSWTAILPWRPCHNVKK